MEWVSGNIYVREMRAKRGERMCDGHSHNFDHTTIVPSLDTPGAVRVNARLPDGKIIQRDFGYGTQHKPRFLVKADVHHEIFALDPPPPAYVVAVVSAAEQAARGQISAAQLEEAVKTFWTAHRATEIAAWCVYSHRTPQGDVVQEYNGWERAYY